MNVNRWGKRYHFKCAMSLRGHDTQRIFFSRLIKKFFCYANKTLLHKKVFFGTCFFSVPIFRFFVSFIILICNPVFFCYSSYFASIFLFQFSCHLSLPLNFFISNFVSHFFFKYWKVSCYWFVLFSYSHIYQFCFFISRCISGFFCCSFYYTFAGSSSAWDMETIKLSLGTLKVVLPTQKFQNFFGYVMVMLWTSQP